MSRGQSLRALVSERLAAAAEEIFVLFERTIAEYEEELCRCKEENHRKQQLLDEALSPRIALVTGNVQIRATSPGPEQNQETTETHGIKEEPQEPSVKQEEEQLPVSVSEFSADCVKTEELLLQQIQTENRDETQQENVSSEPHLNSQTEEQIELSSDTDNDDDWEPISWSAAQMETETERNHDDQDQAKAGNSDVFLPNASAPETSVNHKHTSGADGKKHECTFCRKKFGSKFNLERHIRIHTRNSPFRCFPCQHTFTTQGALDSHLRTHRGEKKYSCALCPKNFLYKRGLERHIKEHEAAWTPPFGSITHDAPVNPFLPWSGQYYP